MRITWYNAIFCSRPFVFSFREYKSKKRQNKFPMKFFLRKLCYSLFFRTSAGDIFFSLNTSIEFTTKYTTIIPANIRAK